MESGELQSRIGYLVHNGRRILHIDHSAVDTLPRAEQARAFFARARKEIDGQPEQSILLLTSLSPAMRFDAELAALEREFAQANTPYVRKSAVVGATAAAKAIMATLRFFTGREIRSFATTAEALDWLTQ